MPKTSGPNAGSGTREAVLTAARRLFTERGFDATSMRDVAAAVGLTNAALYYHFRGKEDLLVALSARRREELDDLLAWARAQEPGPGLLRATALRWVASATTERLEGMRLAMANRPALARAVPDDAGVPVGVEALVAFFAEDAEPSRRLVVRLVFDAFSCAGLAADPGDDLETIRAAARSMVLGLSEP